MRAGELALAAARRPLAATAFLNRLPVGRVMSFDGQDITRSTPLFPLVGALIGAAAGVTADAAAEPLSPLLAGTIGAAVGLALSGAMHLDGLADTADALGSSTREDALRIMRDHSVGVFGAAALVLALVTRIGAYGDLASDANALAAGAAAAACARWVPVPIAAVLGPARVTGQGHAIAGRTTGVHAVVAFGLAAVISFVTVGGLAIPILLGAAACALVLAIVFRYWLGGVTGDVLGAAAEISELASLIVLSALL
jgi:adenosylcobinamide-GDP ribazoletransferase